MSALASSPFAQALTPTSDSENLARLNGTPIPPTDTVSTNDLYIKDAFLVFRALCKLSMKPLGTDRCVLARARLSQPRSPLSLAANVT